MLPGRKYRASSLLAYAFLFKDESGGDLAFDQGEGVAVWAPKAPTRAKGTQC